tara:strand:- start:255 stop:431 length:177 start_codon:yes stop_codon:yes gene_type:complete
MELLLSVVGQVPPVLVIVLALSGRQEDHQEDVVRLVELDVLLEPEEVEEFGTLIVLVD